MNKQEEEFGEKKMFVISDEDDLFEVPRKRCATATLSIQVQNPS